ncbi:MAG: exo-beta-N-acetylmuramidase NamZ domain-containing protein [Fidelibacterota bacterium]
MKICPLSPESGFPCRSSDLSDADGPVTRYTSLASYFLILAATLLFGQAHPSIHQLQAEEHAQDQDFRTDKVPIRLGLEVLFTDSLHLIQDQSVALVTNHTGKDHSGTPNYQLLLATPNVRLKVIFSPEHGLFGEAAAGEAVRYGEEMKALPPVISLYGKTRKPTPDMLGGVDLILYDIQDIGARFYTYISTLGLVMEAAGAQHIPVIVLDRPNPLTGARIDGPVLNPEYQSFVGYYPIPIQYGLTVGELARMMLDRGWIDTPPNLTVIPVEHWTRRLWLDETDLPWIPPSPNIPDLETATVYPGMCLFEGTNVSEGRGTDHPFQWIGAPWIDGRTWSQTLMKEKLPGIEFRPITFTPVDLPGRAMNPKYEGQICGGVALTIVDRNVFRPVETAVTMLTVLRRLYPDTFQVKTAWMNKLWGGNKLSRYLEEPVRHDALDWKDEIEDFSKKSDPFRLYK